MKAPMISFCAALLASGLSALPALAAPPKPDFSNLPAYLQALEQSKDPQAVAIRQEIADGPAALAQEEKTAQQEGVPLNTSLLQLPLPPPSENAALLYQQLDQLRQDKPLGLPKYAQPLDSEYAYTPPQLAAVQKIIDSRPDVFSLLHQAAQMPQCVFQKDWPQGEDVRLIEVAGAREDVRELDTESYLLADEGYYQRAIADQALGYNIARQIASQPVMLDTLVALALEAITQRGMQNILYLAGPSPAVDDTVEGAVASGASDLYPPIQRVMDAEMEVAVQSFDALRKDPATIGGITESQTAQSAPLSSAQTVIARDFIDAAEARYLSLMLASKASPASFDLSDLSDMSSLDPVIALDSWFLFNYATPLRLEKQAQAGQQISMAAAALLAAKAKTGVFPAALPGTFTDPFDGKPLGYRQEGADGFVVYSVGPQGTFNGGQPGQYQFTPYESFFRYPAPPLKPVPADMLQ